MIVVADLSDNSQTQTGSAGMTVLHKPVKDRRGFELKRRAGIADRETACFNANLDAAPFPVMPDGIAE